MKKYIASGAIEELHDVMPHDDDNDYLNDAYNDDDEPSSVAANLDVALPTPLQSAKLAQSLANQSNSSQQSNNGDGNKSEKPRKSRFSDINDMDSNMDMDMRLMHPAMGSDDPYGNGRMGDMMSRDYRDVDYRSSMSMGSRMDSMDMRAMSLEEEMMYGKSSQNYDMPNSRMSSMDVDFRGRYDNYGGDSPKYSNSPYSGDRDSPWNDPYSKGSNSNDGYGFGRNSNSGYSGNQNGSYGSGSGLSLGGFSSNYRGNQSSNMSQNAFGGNQFRPEPLGRDGNWSNMPPRQDNFNRNNNRNNNFNQRRGGGGPSRNQRGPRGGMWMPQRGNNQSRGRNVF